MIVPINSERDLKRIMRRDFRTSPSPFDYGTVFEFFELETYQNNFSTFFVHTKDSVATSLGDGAMLIFEDLYVRCYKSHFIAEEDKCTVKDIVID